jgi:uncharacterized protein
MRIFSHFWSPSRILAGGLMMCASLAAVLPAVAQDLQPVPPLTAQLTDTTLTLDNAGRDKVAGLLKDIETRRGSQIAVLIVNTTAPEPIEDYAHRVGAAWKIGRAGVGDGVLIVLAVQDKKARIDVARALEGAIPDVVAGRIIRETMTPYFKQGDFAGGLYAALQRIDERLAGEALPAPNAAGKAATTRGHRGGIDPIHLLFIGVFIGALLKRFLGGFGALMAGGATAAVALFALGALWAIGIGFGVLILSLIFGSGRGLPFFLPGGGGGGGFGGGSSGGGGWSSGGGGDFSGGGASGSWGD